VTRRIAFLLGVLVIVAIAGPWLAPYDPELSHRDFLNAPPTPPRVIHAGSLHAPFVYPIAMVDRLRQQYEEDRARPRPLPWFADASAAPAFLLGADSFGRDLLSRLLYGARVSLSLALVAVLGALLLGTLLGGLAGFRGGWLDEASMRTADFVAVLPVIYVVLVLRAALPAVLQPAEIFALMASIFAVVGWPFVARGVRNLIAAERDREYVIAARSLGASGWTILRRHLLPICGGFLLVQATILLPLFILAEATLSYVGLGFPDHIATWGTMLRDAANVTVMTRFPWMLTPALAIFFVVLGANVILQSGRIKSRAESRALQLRAGS
jgi:peptide/nickel transport system permease protein